MLVLISSHIPGEHNRSWIKWKQLGCLEIFSTSHLGDKNDSQTLNDMNQSPKTNVISNSQLLAETNIISNSQLLAVVLN